MGGKKHTSYDATMPAGAAVVELLAGWRAATTDDMHAPWRQTGGGGGSEFGKPAWFKALKLAFPSEHEPPSFKLWQLALADHVVRGSFIRRRHTKLS